MSLSIKRKMLVSYLVVLIIPSVMIGMLSYQSAKGKMEGTLMNSALESSQSADRIITQNIQAKVDDLAYLIQQPYVASAESDPTGKGGELKAQLRQYLTLHKEVKDILLGTDSGDFVRASEDPLPERYDVRKQDWYIRAIKQGKGATISPVFKAANGQMSASIAQMLPSGKGVMSIELNLDTIRSLTQMKLGKDGYIVIVDTAKNYVVHPNKTGEPVEEVVTKHLFAGQEGTFSYTYENEKKRASFTTNELTGWKIAGTMYDKEVAGAVSGIRNTVILVISISILAALAIILFNIRSIIKPISALTSATERISKGDLREDLDTTKKDEIGNLSRHFQAMVDNLRTMIVSVQEITDHVNASAKGLAAGADQTTKAIEHVTEAIQEVAAGSDQQLRSVEQSMVSMEVMSKESERIRANMEDVMQTMQRTTQSAEEGNAAVISVTDKIQSIHETVSDLDGIVDMMNERTAQIGEIVNLITGIAQQTHLLALNASIEAARAGEHGRGFAVVAIEVRKLSEQSEKSAQRIEALVSGMKGEMTRILSAMNDAKTRVSEGIEAVDLTGRSFTRIRKAVKGASADIASAAEASRSLAQSGESVEQSIRLIQGYSEAAAGNTQAVSASAQEQLASIEEIASSAAGLNKLAEQLLEQVAQFKNK